MILIPAILEGISTRKDNSLKVVFTSQELSPTDGYNLMALMNSFCFLAIKPETFTQTEKELMQQIKADTLTNSAKSPSQRLRSVLYILFTTNNEGFKTFDDFYKHKIEQMIDHFKTKLP